MADTDDRVVDEMPVFLSKSLVDSLYLFQYPVRPGNISYDDVNHLRARMKPIQQKVEIELALNTRSTSYDKAQGQLLASILNPEDERYFREDLMDKQTLSSTLAESSTSRYAVGCLKDGELHVNSLHGVVQLRPAFTYLDRDDPKQRQERNSTDAEEEVAQHITVKFARPENDKSKKAREKSFRFHQQIMADEAWLDVPFHTIESVKSKITNKKLMCHRDDDHGIPELHVSDKDYLRTLVPVEADAKNNPSLSAEARSLVQLRSFPLSDQIKTIVLNANVISFWQLLSLLPRGTDSNSVLILIQQVAILVQGNWVIKSELLYPKQTRSSHSGLGADVLANGRDYILWNFTRDRYVNRRDMASTTKLPSEDLKEMFDAVSKCRQTKGWEFLLPLDKAFIDKYPDVVQRQQMLWNSRFQPPTKSLKLASEKNNTCLQSPRQRRRTRSQRESDAESEMKEDMRVKSVSREKDDDSEFIPKPEEFRELVSFVKEKMQLHWCINTSELRQCIAQKLAEFSPGHTRISDVLLSQTVEASGASLVQTLWPSNSQEECLYAVTKANDNLDPWRTALFDMFRANPRYRKATIRKKIEEETKSVVADSELGKFLKNYCVSNHSGMYYLKGTFFPDS